MSQIPEFFNRTEIELLAGWGGQAYIAENDPGHQALKGIFQYSVQKIKYWANNVLANNAFPDFEMGNTGFWNKLVNKQSQFRNYLWAPIYKAKDKDKGIFYSVSMNGDENALMYGLFYKFASNIGDSKPNFDDNTKDEIESFIFHEIDDDIAGWQKISLSELKDYNWKRLIEETRAYMSNTSDHYDYLIKQYGFKSGSI